MEINRLMPRQKVNQISAITPFVMSLLAFVLVLVSVATGWDRGTKDEGSAAHIFHLLIALQIADTAHFRFFAYGGLEAVHAGRWYSEPAGRSSRVGFWPYRFIQTVTMAICSTVEWDERKGFLPQFQWGSVVLGSGARDRADVRPTSAEPSLGWAIIGD